MNQIESQPTSEIKNEFKDMCHCEADVTAIDMANQLDLPIFNRQLIAPIHYQNWMMVQYYQMYDWMKMYEGFAEMGYEMMPTLNQLATSHNTEDANSNNASYNHARKISNTFDFENFGISENGQKDKKKHSEMRLKTQEKRLRDHSLNYESRESYNAKTKRTSRVLVCMHDNCGKEFKKTRNLIIHSRVHTKIRPHICKYCQKGFTQQCNLKKHIELHMNGTFKTTLTAN